MSQSDKRTYPRDYGPLLQGGPADIKPVIVGGQAVYLWAETYLSPLKAAHYGSVDLDLLSSPGLVSWLATRPGWQIARRKIWANDLREAVLTSTTSDGRKLHVEVLSKIPGLDDTDLKAVVGLASGKNIFYVLDPVALLKSKVTNMLTLPQNAANEPRQDEQHLKLISQCVPVYLSDVHTNVVEGKVDEEVLSMVLRRLFKAMQNKRSAGVMKHAGISADALVPAHFAQSTLAKIKAAYTHQMPLARTRINEGVYRGVS